MPQDVLFDARYSTEHQNEVQIELGRDFVASRGWKLIEVLAVRARKRDICITVDHISRDAEHGNGFLKPLKFEDNEL